MFCGKSEELIRRLNRAKIAKYSVVAFKADIDNRYNADKVTSHTQNTFEAINVPINEPWKILGHAYPQYAPTKTVIGIDEGQFFDTKLVSVCEDLAERGYSVIIAGLDMDYRGIPFGPIPALLAIADRVDKLTAICTECGQPATRTQRLSESQDLIQVGSSDRYTARCRKHWSIL
jgi:thymidine kinase